MRVPHQDEAVHPIPNVRLSRAREWRRTAWALSALFASLPVACRIFTGEWGFEGSLDISGLCFLTGAYLHFRSRRTLQTPDPAVILDQAIRLALLGQTDDAIALLTEAIHLSPRLWQAFQYRGELRLGLANSVDAALEDFNEAIRLAPEEPDLYTLRARAYSLLGNDSLADQDYQRAAALAQSST
jgi:tetratricopeptide (TPR) repeat protein